MRNIKLSSIGIILIAILISFTTISCLGSKNKPLTSNLGDHNKKSIVSESSGEIEKIKDPLDKSEYYEIIILLEDASPGWEQYKDQNYFRKILKDKFNFGYEIIGYIGNSYEKLALMLASGDYPELISTKTEKYLRAYIQEGALIELGPLMDKYGPDFKERHKEQIPYWKVMSGVDDGKIWFYTTYEPSMSYGRTVAVNEWKLRSDILEQQNYPEIKDEDDLFRILKKGIEDNPYTNNEPTAGFSIPLQSTSGITCATYAINMGRLSHMTVQYGSVWDPYQEIFIDVAKDYSYKDGLLFYNKLWREGLFDKDAVTYPLDRFTKKMEQGYALSTYFHGWDWQAWNQSLKLGGKDYRYIPFPMQLKSQIEKQEEKIYPINNGEIWSSKSITKNARFPERLMEVLNWCAKDEGLIACGWGEEGVQYSINQDGLRIPTPEHLEKMRNDQDYIYGWMGAEGLGFFCGIDEKGQNFKMQHDGEFLKLSADPKVADVYKHYGWNSIYESHNENEFFKAIYDYPLGLKMLIPGYTYQEKKAFERIDMLTNDYTMKLITSKSIEEFNILYAEMLSKRDAFGLLLLIEKRNDEYKRLEKGIN
jgi:putative aldouronate transport system substrate-binding protein